MHKKLAVKGSHQYANKKNRKGKGLKGDMEVYAKDVESLGALGLSGKAKKEYEIRKLKELGASVSFLFYGIIVAF